MLCEKLFINIIKNNLLNRFEFDKLEKNRAFFENSLCIKNIGNTILQRLFKVHNKCTKGAQNLTNEKTGKDCKGIQSLSRNAKNDFKNSEDASV